jgi:ribosomal protein L7/L12
MEYILAVILASVFVLAVFWFVAKTIGRLRVVKNSATLNDLQDMINPSPAVARASHANDSPLDADPLPDTVRDLADAGDKLAATNLYKDLMGVSLMEAKVAVDEHFSRREC